MTILVLGGGGREHAVCVAVKKSELCTRLLCAPGNGGISEVAECFPEVQATDIDSVLELVRRERVDFVCVTPEGPLALGMTDALEAAGVPAFGPRKDAAVLESSKSYSKRIMLKYGIPTAGYAEFTDRDAAAAYIRDMGAPIVVKADGLALGKGVVVAETIDEAVGFVDELMLNGKFGTGGSKVVIEERLSGPEFTVLALSDGKRLLPFPASQDHKRVNDNDDGPNTGGMGAICPLPWYDASLAERCEREIFIPTLEALHSEGVAFKGVIYFGLMLTADGPKVIEYNTRFGDPETQAVLPLLESDLLKLMIASAEGDFGTQELQIRGGASCCVVMSSDGYPGSYETGKEIRFPDNISELSGIMVYHAGTKRPEHGVYVTSGGRVLGVTAVAETLPQAIKQAYSAVEQISFDGAHYRRDIGTRNLTDNH
jgi:phosphoribosylamine--glycine ligase